MGNWVTVTVSVTLTHNGPSGRTPKRRSNGRIHDAAPDLRPTDELQTITHIAWHHTMMGESSDRRSDDLSRHRDRILSPRAPRALDRRGRGVTHDEITNYTCGVALASAPIIPPIQYATNEHRQHFKDTCAYTFAAPHAQKRCRQGTWATTRRHDPIARRMQ